MQKILSTILLLLAFHVWKLGAQSTNDHWTSYLKPSIVNDYLEEADKLYLATDAGVFVMDKSTHAVLEHWTKQSVGIPSNQVESIRRNATTHQIFIGTYDIAAISVQNTDGSWENIPYPQEMVDASSGNPLMTYCIEFDQENRLWVGTSNGALRYDANATDNNWKWYNQDNTGLFFRNVWDMAKDAEGRILLGSNLLFRTAGEDLEQLSPVDANGNPFNLLFSYSDASVHAQADGTIWFFTDVGSVGRYDGNVWEVTTSIENPGLSFQQLEFVTEDREGTLWAQLGWQGFARYNATTGMWEAAEPVANAGIENPTGLYFSESGPLLFEEGKLEWHDAAGQSDATELGNYPYEGAIWRMNTDQEGSLWSLEGITTGSRLRNLESGTFMDISDNGAPFYISDYAFTDEGKLWAISGKRVMQQTDNGWVSFDNTNSDLPDIYGFSNLTIDSYGRVWVAVYGKGIFRYDSANGWKHFDNAALDQNYVIDLEAGADGQVWISLWYTNQGGRLALLDGENLTIYNLNLGSTYYALSVLKFDAQSNRLYGGGAGLGYWEDGAWHTVELPVDFGTSQYIASIDITNGRMILATRETLLLYDGNDWDVFTPENSPLQRRDIYDVGFDAISGRVWIAYSSIRALDVYQTDFLVNATSPGNHLNHFVVQVSPNPFSGQALVEYEIRHTETQAFGRIYSLQGQLLRTFEWDGSAGKHTQSFELENLEAGVYVLEIVAGKQRRSLKIVRQ